ncbi:sigma-70 family RNA polymerase sigma factor [Nannocystis pusilla]|uniref:sigma-70 family RNA polymerase sigma factor n=1 Tax=Nannocystis pusilla TaxID=889268 RepID=UPI003DA38386
MLNRITNSGNDCTFNAPIAGATTARYFRELADVTVMGKDEEMAAATRLVELKKAMWAAFLSYPPFVSAICALIAERLSAEAVPPAVLEAVEKTSRALRDRVLKSHEEAFNAARNALIDRLVFANVDSVVADSILADLTGLEGDRGVATNMKVKPPYRDSAPFVRYVAAARKAHNAVMLAKNAFVRSNLRLVVAIARRFARSSIPLQDLIQDGNMGLMKAVDRFDPTRGCRFATYAAWWIRYAITRAIVDTDRSVRLPLHMIDACKKVNRARREYEVMYGRTPTDEELSSATGISMERIQRMSWSLIDQPLSLSLPATRDGESSLADTLVDASQVAPYELMDSALLQDALLEVFEKLSPMEADILRKRVGMDGEPELTLKEIGANYSLSRERIRQLQEQALRKLRSEFERRQLM